MNLASERPEVLRPIALVGPTASGKSAVAMAFARRLAVRGLRAEIVSVDSALVYRGMDIGTAKPGPAERSEIPHHLIDVIEPTATYSAARFVSEARRAIADIRARGALPLLVGGTMLYLKALRDGIDAMPPADPAVRAELDTQAAQRGWPALHAELSRVDPTTAARLAPGDSQRIQRALEVWRVSGRPLSSWHERAQGVGGDSTQECASQGMDLTLISLEPDSRAWLHERIARRFDGMLDAGLLEEVRRLRARGDLDPALPSMRCVGYRQAWAALQAHDEGTAATPRLEDDPRGMAALRAAGVAATRQLAKRQLTWLRSMRDRQVIPCDGAAVADRVAQAAFAILAGEAAGDAGRWTMSG